MKGRQKGSKANISNIFRTAYRIEIKLPQCNEGDVQLTNRQLVYSTTAVNTAPTTVTTTTNAKLLLLLLLPLLL